jgi:hypothetical protein
MIGIDSESHHSLNHPSDHELSNVAPVEEYNKIILVSRQKLAITFRQGGQSLKTDPYESRILLVSDSFG